MRKPTRALLLVVIAGLSCSKGSSTGPTPPPTITVIPDSATVDLFDTLRLQAVEVSSKGDTLTDAVGWASASPNVVFVSATGRVEGLNRGTVTISATVDGATATARIKVKINVITVELTPTNPQPTAGDTVREHVTLFTADGLQPDDSTPTWTSADTTIAVVSASGLVTTRTAGTVVVRAQVDSAVGSATISVQAPGPAPRPVVTNRPPTGRRPHPS